MSKFKNPLLILPCSNVVLLQVWTFIDVSKKLPTLFFSSWLQKSVTDISFQLAMSVQANNSFIIHQQSKNTLTKQPLGSIERFTALRIILTHHNIIYNMDSKHLLFVS